MKALKKNSPRAARNRKALGLNKGEEATKINVETRPDHVIPGEDPTRVEADVIELEKGPSTVELLTETGGAGLEIFDAGFGNVVEDPQSPADQAEPPSNVVERMEAEMSIEITEVPATDTEVPVNRVVETTPHLLTEEAHNQRKLDVRNPILRNHAKDSVVIAYFSEQGRTPANPVTIDEYKAYMAPYYKLAADEAAKPQMFTTEAYRDIIRHLNPKNRTDIFNFERFKGRTGIGKDEVEAAIKELKAAAALQKQPVPPAKGKQVVVAKPPADLDAPLRVIFTKETFESLVEPLRGIVKRDIGKAYQGQTGVAVSDELLLKVAEIIVRYGQERQLVIDGDIAVCANPNCGTRFVPIRGIKPPAPGRKDAPRPFGNFRDIGSKVSGFCDPCISAFRHNAYEQGEKIPNFLPYAQAAAFAKRVEDEEIRVSGMKMTLGDLMGSGRPTNKDTRKANGNIFELKDGIKGVYEFKFKWSVGPKDYRREVDSLLREESDGKNVKVLVAGNDLREFEGNTYPLGSFPDKLAAAHRAIQKQAQS